MEDPHNFISTINSHSVFRLHSTFRIDSEALMIGVHLFSKVSATWKANLTSTDNVTDFIIIMKMNALISYTRLKVKRSISPHVSAIWVCGGVFLFSLRSLHKPGHSITFPTEMCSHK